MYPDPKEIISVRVSPQIPRFTMAAELELIGTLKELRETLMELKQEFRGLSEKVDTLLQNKQEFRGLSEKVDTSANEAKEEDEGRDKREILVMSLQTFAKDVSEAAIALAAGIQGIKY